MLSLGKRIINSVLKSYPGLSNGKKALPENLKFSTSNPYILEALPDDKNFRDLEILNNKDLKRICRILDMDNWDDIINRYKKFCNSSNQGFSDLEFTQLYRKSFPNVKIPTSVNTDAMVFLSFLDPKVGSQFDAHGLAKIAVTDQLKQLNNLLTKGIDKNRSFYTAPLVSPIEGGAVMGCPGGHAYRDGSFIIVSGKGKTLLDDGIENVIVNDAYYAILSDLKLRFPNVNFVKAEDAVKYFENLAK